MGAPDARESLNPNPPRLPRIVRPPVARRRPAERADAPMRQVDDTGVRMAHAVCVRKKPNKNKTENKETTKKMLYVCTLREFRLHAAGF